MDGTGNISIYGPEFEDEKSVYDFNEPGILAMANSGPNTNGSQFFINLTSLPELNNNYVTFGKVISGMFIIRQIENIPLKNNSNEPIYEIKIIECGEY